MLFHQIVIFSSDTDCQGSLPESDLPLGGDFGDSINVPVTEIDSQGILGSKVSEAFLSGGGKSPCSQVSFLQSDTARYTVLCSILLKLSSSLP